MKGIIDTGASKCYISLYLIPSRYIESTLYKAEVKDTFGKITILEKKLIDFTVYLIILNIFYPFCLGKTSIRGEKR